MSISIGALRRRFRHYGGCVDVAHCHASQRTAHRRTVARREPGDATFSPSAAGRVVTSWSSRRGARGPAGTCQGAVVPSAGCVRGV